MGGVNTGAVFIDEESKGWGGVNTEEEEEHKRRK